MIKAWLDKWELAWGLAAFAIIIGLFIGFPGHEQVSTGSSTTVITAVDNSSLSANFNMAGYEAAKSTASDVVSKPLAVVSKHQNYGDIIILAGLFMASCLVAAGIIGLWGDKLGLGGYER